MLSPKGVKGNFDDDVHGDILGNTAQRLVLRF